MIRCMDLGHNKDDNYMIDMCRDKYHNECASELFQLRARDQT